jgi:hypothetical protein
VAPKAWLLPLAALAALRVALPLVVLAAEGNDLRVVPRYDYVPLRGDANGFYAAVREFISAAGRLGALRLGLLAVAVAVVGVLALRQRRRVGPLVWLAPALAVSLAVAAVIDEMQATGSAVVGWSLVWSIPAFPLRAFGLLDPDSAFIVGLVLSLLANAVTVVATAYVGLFATGRRSVGLGAAALLVAWPLLTRPTAGIRAWENDQWNVDVGLHLYSEPLSTSLAVSALALVLSPRRSAARIALAGALLSFAVAVKLPNVLLLGLVLAVVLWRDGRRLALAGAAGALALAPVALAYWRKGYPTLWDNPQSVSAHPFSSGYVVRNWTESLIFTPRLLIVLLPLLVLGLVAVRSRPVAVLLGGWVLATAAFYSAYDVTRYHPRFLYVALPALFVLEAAGARWLVSLPRARGPAVVRTQ